MHRIIKIGSLSLIVMVMLSSTTLPKERVSPVEVFEQTWRIFDTNYPFFTARGIDWNAIHRIYRPQVTEQSTYDELFRVLCSMLCVLNDGHVNLSNGQTTFNAGVINDLEMDDFSEQLIRTKYLNGKFQARQDSNLVYGWLDDGIGYLRIRSWKQKFQVGAIVDSILAELKTAKGIIVDVRANTGGNAFAAEAIANRFADRKRLYKMNFPKRGPGHDYFFPARYIYVEPDGPIQFTRPVVVLQHRFSESATEGFIQAMRVLPHATTIGEITSGCFGYYYTHELANGWTVGMPMGYDSDQDGRCWEGIGLPPNLRVINTKEDIAAGRDRVLEFAINLIATGGCFGNEVPGSLTEMRNSLYEYFLQCVEQEGLTAAVAEAKRVQSEEPDKYYFSVQELMNGGQVLLEAGQPDVAIAIMELARDTWPDAISVGWALGTIYKVEGKPDKAADAFRLIAERDAYYPWEIAQVSEAREFLEDNK